MSGAEVVGLISGIITFIDAAIKIYDAATSKSSLPSSFRDVATRLPLVHETLAAARDGLKDDTAESSSRSALVRVLEGCNEKATGLEEIFRSVIPPADSSWAVRSGRALKTPFKAGDVERLMEGMLADLQVLAVNQAVKAATRSQVEELLDTARKGTGATVPSHATPHMSFSNTGSGQQVTHTQSGNLNMNTGTGTQFNESMSGTFHFGSFDGRNRG